MPELPEVETVRLSLQEHLKGLAIERVSVTDDYVLRGQAVSEFTEGLKGQIFDKSCRHGKLLFFPLRGKTLCVHLGMTGQLTIRLPERRDTEFIRHKKTGLQRTLQHAPDKHTHIRIALQGGAELLYRDIRKFGRFFWVPLAKPDQIIKHFQLGPDPLTPQFHSEYLYSSLRGRKTAIKSALLNQKLLAGMGNIYVDEALYDCGIRPGTSASRVSKKRCSLLADSIIKVLQKGIEAGGTTLRDFLDAQGNSGYNQEGLQVYGRYGQACLACHTTLRRGTYAGRTTTWCPQCQS